MRPTSTYVKYVTYVRQTVGFTVADEDRERLDRLVEHFGGGNHRRLAEQGIPADELPGLIRDAYKGQQA